MSAEKILKHAALTFLRRDDYMLLAWKTRHIGKGCRNGYGGGIDGDESPEAAALRELKEECRVVGDARALRKIAVADFHNQTEEGESFCCRVHTFTLARWCGRPASTPEMADPAWFRIDALPLTDMMLADRLWLPIALRDPSPIFVTAWYGPHQRELLAGVEVRSLSPGLR
jgi:8-oxo-dGTP pyrophosphatase MutT (NUDIX family)